MPGSRPPILPSLRQAWACLLLTMLVGLCQAAPAPLPPSSPFRNFESGPVRPLAMSPDGSRLFVANTPENRLYVYDLASGTPTLVTTVPVGLEPVAVAARSDHEVWVVNHLSDSVSVVDLAASPPRVAHTLLVGDEPRDIVFAGTGRGRAFITAARRGQNAPFAANSMVAGTPRCDVWVFDANAPGESLTAQPLTVLHLFGDTPRPLAVSVDGRTVYAGVFNSGNRTTTLDADVQRGGLKKAGPQADAAGNPQPSTGLIVRYVNGHWVDNGDPDTGQAPRRWDQRVRFSLPDYDVFAIDAVAAVPGLKRSYSGVGTTLFNMAVNPASGALYVTNTEARNHVRFEGAGQRSTTVRGHFVESRITVISPSGRVQPRHLNKHITTYDRALGTDSERARSLATPLDLAFRSDGSRVYVAAFGSQRVGWFTPAELEANTFTPSATRQIALSAGGPAGLALDEPRNRLYVLTRFDNGLSVVDLSSNTETAHLTMFNPEPAVVRNGRAFLYDARLSSSRGDSSCAGCHVFGDLDQLAWDLGNPDEKLVKNPNRYNPAVPAALKRPSFHPMKGPMTTLSFRGMKGNGPMHWRGDRTGVSASAGETREQQAFQDFNVAFTGLLGRSAPLSSTQMAAFANFALTLSYPPNPHRRLDNTLTAAEQAGRAFYFGPVSDNIAKCNGCHLLNEAKGKFGTDGTTSIEGPDIAEDFKIPHLRNAYQKVGMFGSTGNPLDGGASRGPQIRGFGYLHDGSKDTVDSFLHLSVFNFPNAATRTNVARFVLAFPSDLAPIVGQQITVNPANVNNAAVTARVKLLRNRAMITTPRRECDLVAVGVVDGTRFSSLLNLSGTFTRADQAGTEFSLANLLSAAGLAGNVLTFTCVPPGAGRRIGLDHDLDGVADAEL